MKTLVLYTKTQDSIEKKNKAFSLFWFIFLLTCIFPPMFLPIDVRLAIGLLWIIIGGFKAQNTDLLLIIGSLFLYSFLIYAVNTFCGTQTDFGIPLRYLRCILMLIAISSTLSTRRANDEKKTIISTLAILLTMHSIIILLEIAFPFVKDYMYIFAGKERIFYQYRAGGIVNSFDFAGCYTTIGALLCSLLYCITNKKTFIFGFLVSVVATIFTSRLNMIICVFVLFLISFKVKNILGGRLVRRMTIILTIGVGIIAIMMWAITTDMLSGVRTYLFSRYSWMAHFYTIIRNTYSDDNMNKMISSQFSVNGDSVFKFFGTGMDPNRDPGYVQMIYGIGLIGTLISFVPFFKIMIDRYRYIKHIPRLKIKVTYTNIIAFILGYVILYEFFMNTKILFLYSTGAFEILIIIYMLLKLFGTDEANSSNEEMEGVLNGQN